MTEQTEEIIVLKSTYNKTPGITIKIEPCKDPNGRWPECIRQVNANGDMILSEQDIKEQNNKNRVFLPANEPIEVHHGTVFHLNDPLQSAQWEAIKWSKLIAKERDERDINGNYVIDGAASIVDRYGNPKGTYGLAELYVERPGKVAKLRNDSRRKIYQAQKLVLEDSLDHMIMICRLFDKDMRTANANDIEDYLMTKAEKQPDLIIKYYEAEESKIQLLLIMAMDRKVVEKRVDGFYYGDMKLGSTKDYVADMLKSNKELYENIKKETFPEMTPTKSTKK